MEIQEQLQKIKSDGACYPQQLEEELIRRRRQELRCELGPVVACSGQSVGKNVDVLWPVFPASKFFDSPFETSRVVLVLRVYLIEPNADERKVGHVPGECLIY